MFPRSPLKTLVQKANEQTMEALWRLFGDTLYFYCGNGACKANPFSLLKFILPRRFK